MVKKALSKSGDRSPGDLTIHYQVAMPQPSSHLFEVTLVIAGWRSPQLDLKFPVWTPGSYLVREYARCLQDFTAQSFQPILWSKLSKNHWRLDEIDLSNSDPITIHYRIYANELTVRTNHLDESHGYFNGAALFFYIPGFESQPIQVTIVPPVGWQVSTPLPPAHGMKEMHEGGKTQSWRFYAQDFDTLVDSPFEIGTHSLCTFDVMGKPHELAVWGEGNLKPESIIQDISKIVQVEADLFGGLPYDRYLFLLHLAPQGTGGLEHKFACTLNYARFGFQAVDKYNRFMQLVAHEFFHLWNVKRIRPKALEQFDYDGENYTPSLWFSEGTTSYYDALIPYRAGIYDVKTLLQNLSKDITRLQTTVGRKVQPLSESSFDAWIKLYRQDANSPNAQISYYLKGELVSFLLDLRIRQRHHNQRSLDNVMQQMWQTFGQPEIGFTPSQLQAVIESVADEDLEDFFQAYVDGVEELPFNQYLEAFGLCLKSDLESKQPPYLGITVRTEQHKEIIKFVEVGSPCEQAGISPGDELLAINHFRITTEQLGERLVDHKPGDEIQITVFRQDRLLTRSVTLLPPRPSRYELVAVAQPSVSQQSLFQGWLGVSLT